MRFGSIFLTMDKAQVDLWRTKIIAAYDGEDFSIRDLANSHIQAAKTSTCTQTEHEETRESILLFALLH